MASPGTEPAQSGGMIRRLLAIGLALLLPRLARPADDLPGHELVVSSGYSTHPLGPVTGVPLTLQYGAQLGDSPTWLAVRTDLVLNAVGEGSRMKGSSFGLMVGIEWREGPPDRIHLVLSGLLGVRWFNAPALGADIRLGGGLHLPLGGVSWAIVAQANAVFAVAANLGESGGGRNGLGAEALVGIRAAF